MTERDANYLPRRGFFRNALRHAVSPIADMLESKERVRSPKAGPLLRPPGAIAQERFANVCQRCGACVEACPADAIIPFVGVGLNSGTPHIDADVAACVVCDGLKCTHVCPSGALLPVMGPQGIAMGVAEVYASLCVRTKGETCTLCVDMCPMGREAIRFDDEGPPKVLDDGCVGCGVCQLYCPTTPKAIVVKPASS